MVIGVAGHRRRGLATADAAGLETVLRRILAGLRNSGAVWLVSALTEGADRRVAHLGLELGYRLHVVLPLEACDYEREFDGLASGREFHTLLEAASRVEQATTPPPVFHVEAYAAAGRRIVALSDVVIAVWDGRPPRGRGGTAEVVAAAGRAGVPVVWVSAAPPHRAVLRDDDPVRAAALATRLGVEVAALA